MGSAAAHFQTLCCLGLPTRPALIAIASAIRQIIPASWTRIGLIDAAGRPTVGFGEHPEFLPLFFKTFEFLRADPHSLYSDWDDNFRHAWVGATLHRQGAAYLESAFYRELERPLDSCWLLDANIHDGRRTIAGLCLSRPRSAHPFGDKEVRQLDVLRPWVAHALTQGAKSESNEAEKASELYSVAPLRRAIIALDQKGGTLFKTSGAEHLLLLLDGTADEWQRKLPTRRDPPVVLQGVVRSLAAVTAGEITSPPRRVVKTPWGLIVVEASWLVPGEASPADVVASPGDFPVAVHLELREHAGAYAARILHERGASPSQVRVGVSLALGKAKPQIAKELGIKLSSVEDAARKLYDRLDIHTAAELGAVFWAGDGKSSNGANFGGN